MRQSIDIGPEPQEEAPVQAGEEQPKKASFLDRVKAVAPVKEEEDRKGTWGNSGYSASDDEAHRDKAYSAPSFMKQTMIVFMVQMKLFAKQKWTFIMLFVALLIPLLTILLGDNIDAIMQMMGFGNFSNTYIAGLLALLPLLLGLFTSILCGKQIPQEFKDRTAYMNISLPIHRASFFLGKYLAGFLMCLGIFMLAYGSAIITATSKYDSIYADLLSESLTITLVGVFAYTATAFCIGCFMKKGSSIVPFFAMSIALPLVILIVDKQLDSALAYMPCFLGEAALGLLGAPMCASVILIPTSLDLTSIGLMIAVGIVWGIGFLALGLYQTMRREM